MGEMTLTGILGLQIEMIRKHGRSVSSIHYHGPMDLVVREGTAYTFTGPYDPDRWDFVGEAKACFQNAYWLAEQNDELTYVEGYAMGSILPVPHAWCVAADGEVVDPTWVPENGVTNLEREYLGIPFRLQFVRETILECERYGVLDDWERDFPLCRQPLDREQVAA